MKKSDRLHRLIKSLTQNEKRFFKIFASRHIIGNKSNYVKLFESIDKLYVYDEKKLRSIVKKEKFSGYLSAAKNYLYNLILECLDFYHKDSSIDRQISKYINIARVLTEKRLDEDGLKLIDKARKLSEEYNRFENIVPLMLLQKNTGFNRDTMTAEKLNNYYKEIFSAVNRLRTKLELNKTRDELFLQRRRKGHIKNEEKQASLSLFYSNPYFRDFSKIDSLDANIYYLLTKIEYARIVRDKKMGRFYAKKLIAVFDLHVNRIADNINEYIYVLGIFIGERWYMDNRNEVDAILKKLFSIPALIGKKAVTNDVRVKIFEHYYTGMTDVALKFKDYEGAISLIQKAEREIKKFEKQMTPSVNISLKSNIACIYFGAGNLKQALKWCNAALNDPTQLREDVLYKVRILNLLIHFELGNQLILPNLIKSTYRYLGQRKIAYQFEDIFLKHLRLLLRAETKTEQRALFIQLREKLLPVRDNNLENNIFDDIDIIDWIDKKIK